MHFGAFTISTMTDNYKKKIDYQFVPGPINLMWALDNDCWKAICILIDKENYWKSRSKVFNGYFTLSVEELAEHLRMSNKKDARLTLEALYRADIIDIKAESGKRLGAKIKINWDKITSEDIDWVEKLPRDAKITYCGDTDCAETSTNCTPTLEIEQNRTDIEKNIDTDTEIDTEPTAEETCTPEGDTDLPEWATPVVPKASLPSISVEEPRYSYSTSTDNLTEKQRLLDECLKSFWEIYKEKVDIQLLNDNPQQFLKNNEVKICALHQQILFNAHRDITNQGIVMYLKDYVERQELYQEHEKT